MRTYGRAALNNLYPDQLTWIEVITDAAGFNDYVYCTALVQELRLNLGESPFWGDRGIPAKPSVVQQVAPDYYTFLMQSRYAPYFLNLVIVRVPEPITSPTPVYRINITTHQGVQLEEVIPT